MKIYLVGGAVRDKMLGLPVKERDFVVVGATVDDMLRQGFRKVGKEFPVFLHPKTQEEYALARMEQKTGPGYTGFAFDTSPQVTLEEDLIRRDLTINAMAESEDGELFDPYHGAADLKAKILRHVSPAFAEDPVRILRLGRFLARFYHLGFHVADETVQLMQSMVRAGEVDALVAERVWKELERALGEPHPEQFFQVLAHAEALPILFPALQIGDISMQALVAAAEQQANSLVRFAALTHDLSPEAISALCQRYKLPNDYHTLAKLTATHYHAALSAPTSDADSLLQLFMVLDIFRRKDRFTDFLQAVKAIAVAKKIPFQSEWLALCAEKTRNSSAAKVKHFMAEGYTGMKLAAKLRHARLQIIADYLKT